MPNSKSKIISTDWIKNAGQAPGELIETKTDKGPVAITVMEYDNNFFKETKITNLDDCKQFVDSQTIKWIDVDGIHDIALVEKIGKIFNIHPLTLEDIVSTDQRPKFEDYATYDVVILKMLYMNGEAICGEHLTIILMENLVITFQEADGRDAFDPVRLRIRQAKGRIRKLGSDYLAYALIDSVVDFYFFVLEKLAENIEHLDEELINNPTKKTIERITDLKRELIFLRRNVWPVRELISSIERTESDLITNTTKIYFRDLRDHSLRVMDTVENFREMISGMMDIYMSSLSVKMNEESIKMNEVIKVLTIISAIFIPITFVAGVYGMNFDFMPELHSKYGYLGTWAVILIIVIIQITYFKKRKWL